MWATLTCFLIAQTADLSPSTAIASAHADLARLPAQTRLYTRYLSLHTIPEKERPDKIRVMAGHLNQISRSGAILRSGVLAGGALLRINLLEYGWDFETWETLNDAAYFTVPAGKEHHPAPWLGDREILAQVVHDTGTWVPVVDAEWFFNATATGKRYYAFIGVKDRTTFEKAGGFDRKLFEGFKLPFREAVAISGVTLQPRALVFFGSAGGGYTFSVDFLEAKGKKNPLNILGREIENGDAFEAFILAANGFWRTALFNAKGELQDAAPPEIAGDHTSRSNDKRVRVNISCTRCHTNGGMQDVDGWFRNLLNPPLELRTKDYEKYVQAREEYLTDFTEFITDTRAKYERAVKRATGWDSKTYAKKYSDTWEAYEDAKVDAKWAAQRLGTTEKELRGKLLAAIKSGYYVSPAASVFVHEGARARAIGVRQFEEIIPELYRVVGYPK